MDAQCAIGSAELRKPGHIAGIVALSTLALIGVVSAIAYLHRDTSSDSATYTSPLRTEHCALHSATAH